MGYIGALQYFIPALIVSVAAFKVLGLNKDVINEYFENN